MDNIKLLNVPYGATELKAAASKNTFRGFISALAIYALVAGGIFFKGYLDSTAEIPDDKPKERIINVYDLPPLSFNEPEQPKEEVESGSNVPLKDLQAMDVKPVKRNDEEIKTTKTHDEIGEIDVPVSKDGQEGVANNNTNGTLNVIDRPETVIPEKVPEKPVEDLTRNFELDQVQKSPNALNLGDVQRSMRYPETAVEQEIEGRVTVKVLVDRTGNVIRVGNMTGNSVFHDEVRENIRDLSFEPAIKNGQPVNCWITVPFTFKLNNKFK